MIRKSRPYYKIVYDFQGLKRYEDVKLQTYDRNEAMEYFLDLFKKKQEGSLILEFDCRIELRVEINIMICSGISLTQYKEDDNLNEILDKMEKRVTTSYESLIYKVKVTTDSRAVQYYKSIIETEVKEEALEKFLYFIRQKQIDQEIEGITDVMLEVSISPFDARCLYLSNIKKEKPILKILDNIYIFSKLTKIEKMLIDNFK